MLETTSCETTGQWTELRVLVSFFISDDGNRSRGDFWFSLCHCWFKSLGMWHCVVGQVVSSVLKNYNAFIFRVRQFLLGGLDPNIKALNRASYNLVSHPRKLDSSQTVGVSETSCFKKMQQWAVSKIMLPFVAFVLVLNWRFKIFSVHFPNCYSTFWRVISFRVLTDFRTFWS